MKITAGNHKLQLQNAMQRFYGWLAKVNKKHNILMIWWRYDNEGVPHKIGWRLVNKVCFRHRNIV